MLAGASSPTARPPVLRNDPNLRPARSNNGRHLELVQRYVFMENCVRSSAAASPTNAMSMALKLMETCYVVANVFLPQIFLHGPLAMVRTSFSCNPFRAPGVMLPGVKNLAARLGDWGAETLAVTSDLELARDCTRAIIMPERDR